MLLILQNLTVTTMLALSVEVEVSADQKSEYSTNLNSADVSTNENITTIKFRDNLWNNNL